MECEAEVGDTTWMQARGQGVSVDGDALERKAHLRPVLCKEYNAKEAQNHALVLEQFLCFKIKRKTENKQTKIPK